MGALDRALPMLERALELDPLSPIIRSEYAVSLAANNRMDEALAANAQLLRESPGFATAYGTRATLLEATGDLVRRAAQYEGACKERSGRSWAPARPLRDDAAVWSEGRGGSVCRPS